METRNHFPSSDTPAISLLVANYNNSRYLSSCIDSVLTQSCSDWEIVIVDDASTDDFDGFISPFITDPRIRIYRNDNNKGCSYTKNRLARLGAGQLFAYLDPDDALMPDALALMIQAHVENPECSLVHSTHMICDQHLTPQRRAEYPKALPEGVPYLLLSDGSVHAFASFKKSSYNATAGLNQDRYFDKAIDQELYYLLEEVGSLKYIDHPLYLYRIHKGSISNMGHESAATNVHYEIVMDRCRHRIAFWHSNKGGGGKTDWVSVYKTRYHRVRIIHALRTRRPLALLSSLFQYPFVGGAGHLFAYLSRLLKEGKSVTRKTIGHYKIAVDEGHSPAN